jgi:N-acetylglucosaminyldiphosphoundecaprenol N-acetyl-beta-D-mannosaminyltransferase
MNKNRNSHTLFGITIHRYSIQEALEIVYSKLTDSRSFDAEKDSFTSDDSLHRTIYPIYTINPEFIVLSREFPSYKTVLNNGFISVPDGSGIMLAGLLRGKFFPARITGLDLVHKLTALASEHDLRVGFLGGQDDSAHKSLKIFKNKYPNLKSWSDPGPKISLNPPNPQNSLNFPNSVSLDIKIDHKSYDMDNLLHQIASTDILFVGFGAPKQELFIEYLRRQQFSDIRQQTSDNKQQTEKNRNLKSETCLPARQVLNLKSIICVGVGGSFDEISGVTSRPPQWIQAIGMKWLYRLVTEPWRWKRQTRLLKFLKLVVFGEDRV